MPRKRSKKRKKRVERPPESHEAVATDAGGVVSSPEATAAEKPAPALPAEAAVERSSADEAPTVSAPAEQATSELGDPSTMKAEGAPADDTAASKESRPSGGGRWGFASRALKVARKVLMEDDIFAALTPPAPRSAAASPSTDGAQASSDQDAPPSAQPIETSTAIAATLCGHSTVLAVPEVLGLFATLHKSGTFSVWNQREAFRIRLLRGTVVSAQATSDNHRLLLGRILVDHGAIGAQMLDDFVAALPEPKPRLGDALVAAGMIDRATLESAIQFQAQRVFHAAYDLRDAWYRFDPERDDAMDERGLSVTHLLLESARMRDETEQRLDDVLGDPF